MRCVSNLKLFQELVESKALQKGRFLGLDVGDKYVRISISDQHNKVAMPGSVLLRKKSLISLLASDFQCLISELSIVGLIVGYPLNRQRLCPQAVQVKCLIDDLSATGKLEGVSYTYWNECFTSKNVEQLVQPVNLHPVQSKTIVDKFAALGILQGYLDYVNRNERLRAVEEESDDVV